MADNQVSIRTICEKLGVAISCLAGYPGNSKDGLKQPVEIQITRLLYLAENNFLFIEVPAKTIPARLTLTNTKERVVIERLIGFPVHVTTWEGAIYFRIRCESSKVPEVVQREVEYEPA